MGFVVGTKAEQIGTTAVEAVQDAMPALLPTLESHCKFIMPGSLGMTTVCRESYKDVVKGVTPISMTHRFGGDRWIRDYMPPVMLDRSLNYVLLLSGEPHPSDMPNDDRGKDYCLMQKQIAKDFGLDYVQLDFYIEFGNFVLLDPTTLVMTKDVLTRNPHRTEADLRSQFSQFGIDNILLIDPIETCGHSDALICRIDDKVYIPKISEKTVRVSQLKNDEGEDLTDKAQAQLEQLCNQVKSFIKETNKDLEVCRLEVTIADINSTNNRAILCSPVNMATTIARDGRRELLVPNPIGKANNGWRLGEYLEQGEWTRIEEILDSNKKLLKNNHNIRITPVDSRLDSMGGPHCLTADWPEEYLIPLRDGLP